MTTLELSVHSIFKGEPLTLTLRDHAALADATVVGIELYRVQEAETAPGLMTGLHATFANGELTATLEANISDMLQEGRIYEVMCLKPTNAQGNELASLLGGLDFPRTFFHVKADPGEPDLTAEEVAEIALGVERGRDEMYAEPLGDSSAPGVQEFRIMMFVERLRLTRPLRLPGMELAVLLESREPVQRSFGLGASDEVEIINQVLRSRGWVGPQASVDPSWREKNAHHRPVVVLHAPKVFASTAGRALRVAHEVRDRMLELLAFHRNSSGVPFATAIQQLDVSTGRYMEPLVCPEVEIYKGNLMGGSLSGEDQSVLLADYEAMRSDPFLSFVLYLHAEAQAEKELDFAYFRYWNLLETIAAGQVEMGTLVTDFEGEQILKADGEPFDTGGARGRVYELVKRGMLEHVQSEETHQEARDLSLGLWEAVHVWYTFRNATAHHGGFNPDDPRQRRQSWYRVAVEAQRKGAQPSGYGDDPYFGYLKAVTSDVVRWALQAGGSTGARFLESGENTTSFPE